MSTAFKSNVTVSSDTNWCIKTIADIYFGLSCKPGRNLKKKNRKKTPRITNVLGVKNHKRRASFTNCVFLAKPFPELRLYKVGGLQHLQVRFKSSEWLVKGISGFHISAKTAVCCNFIAHSTRYQQLQCLCSFLLWHRSVGHMGCHYSEDTQLTLSSW